MRDFVFRQHDDLQHLVCEPLEQSGFKNAFSTRLGGVSRLPSGAAALSLGNFSHDERERVLENRRRFLKALGAEGWTLVTAKQVHSAEVRRVRDADDARQAPEPGDALMADFPRTLLAVQTADCLPVLLVDERTRSFAAIHAGWRGTLARIVARTVERMQLAYDSRPEELRAALGPGIGVCCFEVGPEVLDAFRQAFPYAEALIAHQQANGKGHLKINQANVQQLIDCGVRADRIYDCALCTSCRTDLFFSYRRERGAEQHVGRLMGVVGRE
jgi:YfiH family protein